MILSAATIRRIRPVDPFVERGTIRGRSYGLSVSSYDVRIKETFFLEPGQFRLGSTIEQFDMPLDVVGLVKDKSSWARRGLSVFNTLIDPGWRGFLTLELVNHGHERLRITEGDPIAQILFQTTDQITKGYTGKYLDQESGPQEARYEV